MDKEEMLLRRLDQNLADYHAHVKGFGKGEIIEMAGQIAAVSDAHYYLQDHHVFEPEQVDFLLRFENPLEVVADAWQLRQEDISDMSFTLDAVFDGQDALQRYAPATAPEQDARKEPAQRPSVREQLLEAAKTAKEQQRPKPEMPGKKMDREAK